MGRRFPAKACPENRTPRLVATAMQQMQSTNSCPNVTLSSILSILGFTWFHQCDLSQAARWSRHFCPCAFCMNRNAADAALPSSK